MKKLKVDHGKEQNLEKCVQSFLLNRKLTHIVMKDLKHIKKQIFPFEIYLVTAPRKQRLEWIAFHIIYDTFHPYPPPSQNIGFTFKNGSSTSSRILNFYSIDSTSMAFVFCSEFCSFLLSPIYILFVSHTSVLVRGFDNRRCNQNYLILPNGRINP